MQHPGPVQERIRERLTAGLACSHLEIDNESHKHRVPPGSESHFRLVIVSEDFGGHRLVARHRLVNRLLREELAGQVHALALHTFTEAEWRQRHGDAPMSPPCRGGEGGAAARSSAPAGAGESGGAPEAVESGS